MLWPYRAKIQFESNSQHVYSYVPTAQGCGLTGRRYNLKATHNWTSAHAVRIWVVALPGEDTIWKQLTTRCVSCCLIIELWPYRAKIQFESNSQQTFQDPAALSRCGLTGRRYNLKATHNKYRVQQFLNFVVALPGEDTIWKQLTTSRAWRALRPLLWPYRAKIQFESNSQQFSLHVTGVKCCGLTGRRYNLKATHNFLHVNSTFKWVVALPGEDTIWKQLTTENSSSATSYVVVALPGEDTIWKQLTTAGLGQYNRCKLWPYRAKIQFESNSQLISCCRYCWQSCGLTGRRYNLKATHNKLHCSWCLCLVVALPGEDTIWKQLTTKSGPFGRSRVLWPYRAKIQFESNSQPHHLLFAAWWSCGLTGRRYNLKATHNLDWRWSWYLHVVALPGEDTIWKQLTTDLFREICPLRLWPYRAKIQFESNSQLSFFPL